MRKPKRNISLYLIRSFSDLYTNCWMKKIISIQEYDATIHPPLWWQNWIRRSHRTKPGANSPMNCRSARGIFDRLTWWMIRGPKKSYVIESNVQHLGRGGSSSFRASNHTRRGSLTCFSISTSSARLCPCNQNNKQEYQQKGMFWAREGHTTKLVKMNSKKLKNCSLSIVGRLFWGSRAMKCLGEGPRELPSSLQAWVLSNRHASLTKSTNLRQGWICIFVPPTWGGFLRHSCW